MDKDTILNNFQTEIKLSGNKRFYVNSIFYNILLLSKLRGLLKYFYSGYHDNTKLSIKWAWL